ncbi:glycosyltransferase [Sulfurovum sp.]|uniref:glycosyltransferase n=1 Tax=Sulfurovum sp. TaxID=1969726 RepID=UPI003566CA16
MKRCYVANVFYISLTGMTEPLGRSQVLEYLMDLSKENEIYLLSFERENDLKNVDEIQELIKDQNIQWQYLTYSNKYGVISTLWQLVLAIRLGSKTVHKHSIDIVHARSMIPATMGWVLKKMHGVKLLFDIRGFAIDEKVDSGRLQKSSLLYKLLKKLDNHLYKVSDHIVTLTHAAKEILHNSLNVPEEKITVIPTCANKELFKLLDEDEKRAFKSTLGYSEKDKIVVHTGTVSGWYDFESEVKLVKELMRQDEDVHFLVLNKHEQPFIQKMISKYLLPLERVKISSSAFDEVYKYLNIADVSLFFIKPSFSKQASAPTKFAENVACLLPSITNGNVGDMGFYLEHYSVGKVIDLDTLDDNLALVATELLREMGVPEYETEVFERLFSEHFDKEMAVRKYQAIYEQLESATS